LSTLALILLVVMLSGYLLIYNIFYISVANDIQRYGLLKTIGATGRQIRGVVNLQALFYCLAGIPAGLALGYFLAGAMFPLLISLTSVEGFAQASPDPLIFLSASALSLATVFASCNAPARMAGKVSPVEASKYVEAGARGRKRTKRGVDGASLWRMAFANLFRNRRKTIVALASVSMSLILFNITLTFTSGFDAGKALDAYLLGDFIVAGRPYLSSANARYSETHALSKEAVESVAGLEGVLSVADVYYDQASGGPKGGRSVDAQVYGLDEAFLDHLAESVIEGGFDKTKFLSGGYAVIASDPESLFKTGDIVELRFEEEAKDYEVMAFADYSGMAALSAGFYTIPGFSVYLPEPELAGSRGAGIMSATVFAEAESLKALKSGMAEALAAYPGLDFRSRADYLDELESGNLRIIFVGTTLCAVVLLIGF
jgi:putative ABC transport system permease protein